MYKKRGKLKRVEFTPLNYDVEIPGQKKKNNIVMLAQIASIS